MKVPVFDIPEFKYFGPTKRYINTKTLRGLSKYSRTQVLYAASDGEYSQGPQRSDILKCRIRFDNRRCSPKIELTDGWRRYIPRDCIGELMAEDSLKPFRFGRARMNPRHYTLSQRSAFR